MVSYFMADGYPFPLRNHVTPMEVEVETKLEDSWIKIYVRCYVFVLGAYLQGK